MIQTPTVRLTGRAAQLAGSQALIEEEDALILFLIGHQGSLSVTQAVKRLTQPGW